MAIHHLRGIKYRAKYSLYTFREANHNFWRGDKIKYSQVTYCMAANAGDTTLSRCVRRAFEADSADRGVMWNLIPVTGNVTHRTIERINNTSALIIGGGGLFLPDTNRNNISGWQWAVSEELLHEIECPVIVYSVGYNFFRGQTNSPLFIRNLTALCEKAEFIGLRNHGSIRAVRSLLPEHLREKVIFQPCTTTVIRKLYGNALGPKIASRKIAVNMAFDRAERRYGERKEVILNGVARFCKLLEKKGYQILFVCHMDSDAEFFPYLDKWNINYTVCNLANAWSGKVMRFYNGVEVVIGMRGHAQMIPFGTNCEIITLGSHEKMKWFLEDIHAEDWYVDLNRTDVDITEELLRVFENVHEKNDLKTKEQLLKEQETLWKITCDNMERINRMITPSA